jgi:hypothetical protein
MKPQWVARAEVQPTCVGLANGSLLATLRASFSLLAPSLPLT